MPEFSQETSVVFEGGSSQRWGRPDKFKFHGGICQQLDVSPGQSYHISAWLRFTSTEPSTWIEFGYDLTGQTSDGEGGTITYTKLEGNGQNVWIHYEADVTATGSTMSLFTKMGHWTQPKNGPIWGYVDSVTVTEN